MPAALRNAPQHGVHQCACAGEACGFAQRDGLVDGRSRRDTVKCVKLADAKAQDIQHPRLQLLNGRRAELRKQKIIIIPVLQYAERERGGQGGLSSVESFPLHRAIEHGGEPGVVFSAALERKQSDLPRVHQSTVPSMIGWPRRKSAAFIRFLPGACSSVTSTLFPSPQTISIPFLSAFKTVPGAALKPSAP